MALDEYGNEDGRTDLKTRAGQSSNGYNNGFNGMDPRDSPLSVAQRTTSASFTPNQRDSVVQGWLASSAPQTRQGVEQYLASGPGAQGWTIMSDDKVKDPGGRVYDWIGNVNTADAQKRSGYTTDSRYASVTGAKPGKSKATAAAPAVAAVKPVTTSTSSVASQSIAPVKDPRLDELYNTLMTRASQGLDVDRNNPVIRQQADAFSANEERSRRNYLADIAESSGPLTNLQGEARMTAERVGQRTGQYEGELMGRELTAKRSEIAEALQSMQGLLSTEQTLALQMKLKQMDDALARLGLSQNNSQFNASLGLQRDQMNQQNSQFGQTLAQQNSQFGQSLGYNYDQFDWARSPMNPNNFPTSV